MALSLSRLPEYPIDWHLIKAFSDVAGGDIVSFDTGVMSTTFDIYKIIGLIENTDVAFSQIRCQLNNDGSVNYHGTVYNNAGINITGALGHFFICEVRVSETSQFEYIIRGKSTGAIKYPTITGNSSCDIVVNGWCLLRGQLRVDIATVNRIKVFTDLNCIGKMKVFGMNLDV